MKIKKIILLLFVLVFLIVPVSAMYAPTNISEIENLTVHNWTYIPQQVLIHVPSIDAIETNESKNVVSTINYPAYNMTMEIQPLNIKSNVEGMDLILQLLVLIAITTSVMMFLMIAIVIKGFAAWVLARRRVS